MPVRSRNIRYIQGLVACNSLILTDARLTFTKAVSLHCKPVFFCFGFADVSMSKVSGLWGQVFDVYIISPTAKTVVLTGNEEPELANLNFKVFLWVLIYLFFNSQVDVVTMYR